MNRHMSKRIQLAPGLCALILFSMMAISSAPAFALTAFTPQNQPIGYVAQDTLTAATLTSGNETEFHSTFEKAYWSGDMYNYPVSALGVVGTGDLWSGGSAAQINTQASSNSRKIGTMSDTGAKVPFLAANLSATQQGTLATTINAAAYTSTQIVNFLRGDHTNEGASKLRIRLGLTMGGASTQQTVLGDIIHSKSYFLNDSNNPTIFVGANDGMLHAINATDGTERWAYVPSMLIPKMNTLANNPYTHDYFVDGQIDVGNAVATTTGGNTTYSTRILVGALGGGGKGLYALNIDGSSGLTAANDQAAANKVIWEITPTQVNYAAPQMDDGSNYVAVQGYGNLGYTYGAPLIRTINNGGVKEQVVIVGNGYNNGGDYKAYLFVINAANGKLVTAIRASSSGGASSPNGLMKATAVDTNADGNIDTVYAGDIDGTLWKFDLSSTTPSSWTASALYVTSPAQPITVAPTVVTHTTGIGYMVNFATGSIFTGTQPTTGTGATGDLGDTSSFYVYGVWDGAPAGNTTLVQPVITERCYNLSGVPSVPPCPVTETRVRRVDSTTPNWATDKGWKVQLPIGGERVIGEGISITNYVYFFSTYNPTISYLVPGTTSYQWGENWNMALHGVNCNISAPFMDLNNDTYINDNDRIMYTAADAPVVANPPTAVMGTPIMSPNVDGIEIGKWLSRGVSSQPKVVYTAPLFSTLAAQNPDVTYPPPPTLTIGVNGGHFDVDNYWGSVTSGSSATATITVNSTGSISPATLGGIQVAGTNIVPALSVADLPNGTSTATNAATIKNKFIAGLYTATVSGSTVTIKAPVGAAFNGKALTVIPGSTFGTLATASVYPTGLITFGGSKTGATSAVIANNVSGGSSVKVGTVSASTVSITLGTGKTPTQVASTVATAIGTSGTIKAYIGGSGVTPTCQSQSSKVVCLVDTSTYSNGSTVTVGAISNMNTLTVAVTATAGGAVGTSGSGWSDLSTAITTTSFSGGADGITTGDTCTGSSTNKCQKVKHVHQYDKMYDVTGVNFLNPNEPAFNLVNAIPSTSQKFKVIMHNQYLNPALNLHIGDSTYAPSVNLGYQTIKTYTSNPTLDLATLPTYIRDPFAAGDGFAGGAKYIGSLVVNMPVDALSPPKDWWGNLDVRAGLIPTQPSCVYQSAGTSDGNMYKPVKVPANGGSGYPPNVPGTDGYSSSIPTTPATATGVRHGGALTLQVIRDTTPNTDLELNDDLGRPEYGWRVKSANYAADVLVEYNIYWHHVPSGLCFDQTGWVKDPLPDFGTATPNPTPGATDPKVGSFQGTTGGTVQSVVTSGDTTTITYTDGSVDVIQTFVDPATGNIITIKTHFPPSVFGTGTLHHVINANGTITSTWTPNSGSAASGNMNANGGSMTLGNLTVSSTATQSTASKTGTGVNLKLQKTGVKRLSWKELVR